MLWAGGSDLEPYEHIELDHCSLGPVIRDTTASSVALIHSGAGDFAFPVEAAPRGFLLNF